jgi:hypothetical protein
MGLFGIGSSWREANKSWYAPDSLTEPTRGYPQSTTPKPGVSKSMLLRQRRKPLNRDNAVAVPLKIIHIDKRTISPIPTNGK